MRSAAISGSGVFRDEATDERARAIFFAGEIPAFQVIVPDFGIIEGPFQITSIEYSGQPRRRGGLRDRAGLGGRASSFEAI